MILTLKQFNAIKEKKISTPRPWWPTLNIRSVMILFQIHLISILNFSSLVYDSKLIWKLYQSGSCVNPKIWLFNWSTSFYPFTNYNRYFKRKKTLPTEDKNIYKRKRGALLKSLVVKRRIFIIDKQYTTRHNFKTQCLVSS